ncbi:MAG TPA: M23 family metallopeptidase [Vicinamibacterales bacterium]|jgi:murein DD-endopeptidase MepM/ murein hydrolase activator NlpD
MKSQRPEDTSAPGLFKKAAPWVVFAGAVGFLGGMLVMAALFTIFPDGAARVAEPLIEAAPKKVEVKPTKPEEPRPVTPPPPAAATATPAISSNVVEELRHRALTLPVQGIKREDLRDTFSELRGSSRRHEALDVLAPRNTPVLAVEDGTVARLFLSDAGGITIYQYDPTRTYVYYYAHLERYAEGLKEGATVKRGDTIGYVGTTGNAPRETPHLHFAIFQMTEEKRWWEGTAIDPYSVLK